MLMSPGQIPARPIDYTKLRRDLAQAVARVCPRWQPAFRDDLVQAAVMRVMQIIAKSTGQSEGDPPLTPSYLYKVAYSVLIDEIRRERRRSETSLEEEAVAQQVMTENDPERLAASHELGRGIQDCLTRIKRERRLAVTLHLQGHSVPEAARLLDWAVKRTENLVYRGLADLRECLTAKGMGL
jgi:RNA polymerase sigma-70 factor (ECF subfamily)